MSEAGQALVTRLFEQVFNQKNFDLSSLSWSGRTEFEP